MSDEINNHEYQALIGGGLGGPAGIIQNFSYTGPPLTTMKPYYMWVTPTWGDVAPGTWILINVCTGVRDPHFSPGEGIINIPGNPNLETSPGPGVGLSPAQWWPFRGMWYPVFRNGQAPFYNIDANGDIDTWTTADAFAWGCGNPAWANNLTHRITTVGTGWTLFSGQVSSVPFWPWTTYSQDIHVQGGPGGRLPWQVIGPNSGNCFVGGTLVLSSDGLVPIESIKEGDAISTFDFNANKLVIDKVDKVYKSNKDNILILNFGTEKIKCTEPHPFYVNGRWITAEETKIGDLVMNSEGEWIELKGKEKKTELQDVFDLRVNGNHNFFVGNLTLLVHNKGPFDGSDWGRIDEPGG